MTFQSELARKLFHELPTDIQITYSHIEQYLAGTGKILHVVTLIRDDKELQVFVCITEELNGNTGW